MRLQVFLSHNDVCSRRKAFAVVQSGRVTVNGRVVTEPGHPVNPAADKISVDGKLLRSGGFEYILLNKPAGYVTTKSDRFAEKTVYELLPQEYRHLAPAGRLDKDTEGLLLFTNDGEVIQRLTHPRFETQKKYRFQFYGSIDQRALQSLERGVMLDGKKTAPAKIEIIKQTKGFTDGYITIHEGRKRQVRLMFQHAGRRLTFLQRVAHGPLSIKGLATGLWRNLTQEEIIRLKNMNEA